MIQVRCSDITKKNKIFPTHTFLFPDRKAVHIHINDFFGGAIATGALAHITWENVLGCLGFFVGDSSCVRLSELGGI